MGTTFSEFIEEKGAHIWIDALRIFANVQGPLEERPKEEWERLFEELKNKKVTD